MLRNSEYVYSARDSCRDTKRIDGKLELTRQKSGWFLLKSRLDQSMIDPVKRCRNRIIGYIVISNIFHWTDPGPLLQRKHLTRSSSPLLARCWRDNHPACDNCIVAPSEPVHYELISVIYWCQSMASQHVWKYKKDCYVYLKILWHDTWKPE
jgi:hypothetical protein